MEQTRGLLLHMRLGCGSLSITTRTSITSGECVQCSERIAQASELGSSQSNLCNSWGYRPKDSLKDCFENVYIYIYYILLNCIVMVFYDIIIMWLSCDPEILSFLSKVWFIELAEVFGVKIMCIYMVISVSQKLHI